MLRRIRIRITGRPAALAAVLAAVLATVPAPVAADGSDGVALRLEVPAEFRVYDADEGAAAVNSDFVVPVAVAPGDGGPARNVKVTVDASGLEGVARAGKGGYGNCTGGGPVFTCEYGDVQNGDGEANAPFTLRGVDGVEPGDSGTVTYTATADNAAPVTGTTRMTVGGPALHSPEKAEVVKGVEPGKSVPLTPRFANNSRFPARSVVLSITAQDGLLMTSHPDNCYFDTAYTSAWCTFPTKAAPDTAYRTGSPIGYTAGRAAKVSGVLSYSWSAGTPRPEGLTVRGEDAPLTLTRTAGDDGLTGRRGTVDVETTVQVDYEPVTATVRGRVGDTVKVRLGLRDHGPGRTSDSETLGGFEVVPPEGTTVTSVPFTFEDTGGEWACDRPGNPGGAIVCDIGEGGFMEVLDEGGTTAIDFHFRIDRQVPGTRGTIRTYNRYDRTAGNDLAVIPLDASPALPYRPNRDPVVWAVSAVTVVVLVALYRWRRRVSGREDARASRA